VSAQVALARLRQAAIQRRLAILLCAGVPVALAAGVLALLVANADVAAGVLVAAALVLSALAWRAVRGVDGRWLARRLDAAVPAMEDSAELLLAPREHLAPLQQLQRQRLAARLAGQAPDLRPPWPRPLLATSVAVAAGMLALALALPPAETRPAQHGERDGPAAADIEVTQLLAATLTVTPPTYTRLPAAQGGALDARVPEGAALDWRLRLDPVPRAAALVFHDGSRVPLARAGRDWTARHVAAASALYRIVPEGVAPLADDRLYRIDVVPDEPPQVRVTEPARSLALREDGQRVWQIAFEASDDYGIAGASLSLTLAQGSGEAMAFHDQRIALQPAAAGAVTPAGANVPAHRQSYAHPLDLAALGVGEGDDVIVRAEVEDNREPRANTTRSASFILRWPAPASSESAGLEGLVQRTLPAYFRSQRQIIIDTEALLAEQTTLAPERFLARSDSIGVDQKILRLRYGEFLGEESESAAVAAHAEGDEPSAGRVPDQRDALAAAHAGREAHAPATAPAAFGRAGDVIAEYGHVHDIAEAATLLDARTRQLLKAALDEMWQAEGQLRLGQPAQALPFEHRALELVKQAQQATRIHLARVGLELPLPDEGRRLGGDRDGVVDPSGNLGPAQMPGADAARLWQALADQAPLDWDAAARWLGPRAASDPAALGVLAAIDQARRDPACAACREHVRALLWPFLPVPAAAALPRAVADPAGDAYLDALDGSRRAGSQP
jgi:hypothetical protein